MLEGQRPTPDDRLKYGLFTLQLSTGLRVTALNSPPWIWARLANYLPTATSKIRDTPWIDQAR